MKNNNCSIPAYLIHDKALPSPAGDRYKPKNMIVTNESSLRLQKVSDIDIQAEINSYEDSCCLQSMIAKATRANDMSFLIRKQGVFADVSGMEPDLRVLIDSSRNIVSAVNAAKAEPTAKAETTAQAEPTKEVTNV